MGEVAESILEGIICQDCGEFIAGEAPGHPRSCTPCSITTTDWRAPREERMKAWEAFIAAHPDTRWIKHSKWHYMYPLPDGQPFHYWPSKFKWRAYNKTQVGNSHLEMGNSLRGILRKLNA